MRRHLPLFLQRQMAENKRKTSDVVPESQGGSGKHWAWWLNAGDPIHLRPDGALTGRVPDATTALGWAELWGHVP